MKYLLISLLVFGASIGAGQTIPRQRPDSTMVFGTMQSINPLPAGTATFQNSIGLDAMISTNGFGAGMFFRHEYSDDLAGFIDFSLSEAKDDDEKEFIDYYGQVVTPGKVNRFLILPVFVGLQKRLFKDDILDNFRPYVMAAAGPSMIYVFPYNDEYFSALGKGTPKYTMGGYFGFGAYFGSERSSLLGVNMRYYYIPYFPGLESMQNTLKKQFGGFTMSISFGNSW